MSTEETTADADFDLSVVIPSYNTRDLMEQALRTVQEASGKIRVEVIVVDNNSEDGTYDFAGAAGAHCCLVAGPERSAQRNRGWQASTGEYVVFIDSDMVLRPGLADGVRSAFDDAPSTGALVLPELAFGDGYLAACRGLEKRAYLGDRRAEAARAFRATVLDDVGGYNETVFGFEDFELADRVENAEWILGRAGVGVDHDEGRISLVALFRKKRYYGTMFSHVHPRSGEVHFDWSRRGGRAWRGLLSEMVHDPLHAPGLVLLKTVDVAGLFVGHRSTRATHA